MNFVQFAPQTTNVDRLYRFFMKLTRGLLIVAVSLLPLLFVPGIPALTPSIKTHFMAAMITAAVMTYSLAILRRGSIALRVPTLLLAWGSVVFISIGAGLLAPQSSVAFWGGQLEIHTVGFLLVGLVIMLMMGVFKDAKSGVIFLYGSLCVSAVILALIHVARLLFGADILSFGLVNSPVATLIGSFNDLAIFFTLVIIVGLISLIQLNLPRYLEVFVLLTIVSSLVMLGVINFTMTWYVVGFFSLLLLMFTLTKGRIGKVASSGQPASLVVVGALAISCLMAILFVIGGTTLGAYINSKTGISYLEVRPSLGATLDILKGVFNDRMIMGAGPNHFHEAWQLYKDQSLNTTLFWNTPFYAGSSYLMTWFVTSGLFAIVAWVVFLSLLLWQGARVLLRPRVTDYFWYFIATISFTVAVFVWLVALFYVPGSVILMLGFTATGLFVVAYEILMDKPMATFNLFRDSRTGFVLIAGVMIVVVLSVAVEYYLLRQVLSIRTFNAALEVPPGDAQLDTITRLVAKAHTLDAHDGYVRDLAQYYLEALATIIAAGASSPTEVEKFNAVTTAALEAGNIAIKERASDARNWAIRGDIYELLARLKIEGAYDRAKGDYSEAVRRDPQNPYYDFKLALLELTKNNVEGTRSLLLQSLQKKPNYTDALSVLAELDVASGNIDEAIKTTQSILALEANNAGRYYQLGVLLQAKGDDGAAKAAFIEAITRDPQYANARYLLALLLLKEDNVPAALEQLRIVRELNPANEVLGDTIARLEGGESATAVLGQQNTPITEPEPNDTDSTVDPTVTVPESDLLVPVNTVPAASDPAPTE
ncbi:MAG: hypothetical protein RLZZ360_304 [Candidatus Parcubacteria bacterium]|jgi:tetratricopeptide (TPR) repeat protein